MKIEYDFKFMEQQIKEDYSKVEYAEFFTVDPKIILRCITRRKKILDLLKNY
jgi:predicted DNA-binding protein YlxM (UPF0122 family)